MRQIELGAMRSTGRLTTKADGLVQHSSPPVWLEASQVKNLQQVERRSHACWKKVRRLSSEAGFPVP